MRTTEKTISISFDGHDQSFRLRKMDAFSGACLLKFATEKLLPRMSENEDQTRSFAFSDILSALSEPDLISLMTRCLSHVDILLPAGPHPVYQNQIFGLPELETDTLTCLNLCWEEMLFNLEGFFGESGSPSAANPN